MHGASRNQNHPLAALSSTVVLEVSDRMEGHSHPPRMDLQAACVVHLVFARPPHAAAAVTVEFAAERSAPGAGA